MVLEANPLDGGVNKGYRERLVNLRTMISNESNYKVYRAKLKEVQAPCIPFFGLYLTAVMMIKDGNSMYKDPSVKSILPGSRQSHASSRISTSSAVSMASHCTAAAQCHEYPLLPLHRHLFLEFRIFQGQYEYLEVQPQRNYVEHKLNSTDPQDSERNYRKSYAIEPWYHPPASPGTAHPPPGHHRPMLTSYLPQPAIGPDIDQDQQVFEALEK
ncbi:hypothetical protein DFQ27_000906 [Actinomortierella ambigua]|uniref:Ras-GEF domain-containing protein n=1 Tax=Actinomortierella ambigua TaxID=1343610 RepID=A0A9P6QGG3_9FUNG|nr:hypothetical protein DFQ27_000906 [Actinomortierella ambigua]